MEATGAAIFRTRSAIPAAAGRDARVPVAAARRPRRASVSLVVAALENGASASDSVSKKSVSSGGGGRVPNSNYVVPFDLTPSFCRPLKEILRDLNKKVPDNIINADDNSIPWYQDPVRTETRFIICSYTVLTYKIRIEGVAKEKARGDRRGREGEDIAEKDLWERAVVGEGKKR
ncbi:hypothetical protein BHE74_00048047 [Ensete ventricosum]|nr:hypothetical protein BHE74_00048047 [Ensete ventricosum]RZS19593.1 hypothetical protein BHM03_00052010 [Ensete ventricosum]